MIFNVVEQKLYYLQSVVTKDYFQYLIENH